jgi:S1-C subfamily serine protease
MSHRITLILTLAFTIVCLCGCSSLTKPSDATRHASYARVQSQFTGDTEKAVRATYLVLSGGPKSEIASLTSRAGSGSGSISFTNFSSAERGLGIALESDGYLLTAGHVVGKTNFVMGWFDGRIDFRPARVVFDNGLKFPNDVALLKVEGKLDDCVAFGQTPKVGDTVVEVVCYHGPKESGGEIAFAGGKVLKVMSGAPHSSLNLLETDVPAWHGDSGGPLLSSDGRLVGIFTEFHYWWPGHTPSYWTTCFFPDEAFVRELIAKDRSSGSEKRER